MEYTLKIIDISDITYDVKRVVLEKPVGFNFVSGHSAMLSVNSPELSKKKRPYCFTSTNEDPYLEFIIKKYKGGISEKIHFLKKGDSLILSDRFGSHRYMGKGIFLAGGAGITPFLSIFRQLKRENEIGGNILIYSNKTSKDIIAEKELKDMMEENCIFTLTRERNLKYEFGRIDSVFLKKHVSDFNGLFYICGPEEFEKEMKLLIFGLKKS